MFVYHSDTDVFWPVQDGDCCEAVLKYYRLVGLVGAMPVDNAYIAAHGSVRVQWRAVGSALPASVP
jgi:hypothetical protein